MKYRLGVSFLLLSGTAAVLAGCGDSGSETVTTVIREAAPTTVEKTTTVTAPDPEPRQGSASPAPESTSTSPQVSPPNVVGLTLPAAEQRLKAAGYTTDAENTDTTFGIIVPDNYTICEQDPPSGKLVHVLAQKYGC